MSWGAVLGSLGAVGGALRGIDQQKRAQAEEDATKKLAAETARYSPWTGMTPQAIHWNNQTPFGAAIGGGLQGGLAAAQLGASLGTGGMAGAAAPMAMGAGQQSSALAPNVMQGQQSPWSQMQKPNYFGNYA